MLAALLFSLFHLNNGSQLSGCQSVPDTSVPCVEVPRCNSEKGFGSLTIDKLSTGYACLHCDDLFSYMHVKIYFNID